MAGALFARRRHVRGTETLEEVVISASLRSTPLRDLPQSATVLDSPTLREAGVQHFEDVSGPGARA